MENKILESLNELSNKIDSKFEHIDTKFENIESRLKSLENKQATTNNNFNILRDKVRKLSKDIDSLDYESYDKVGINRDKFREELPGNIGYKKALKVLDDEKVLYKQNGNKRTCVVRNNDKTLRTIIIIKEKI